MVHTSIIDAKGALNQVRKLQVSYNRTMSKRHRCDLCFREIAPHAHYIVRIEVFADPTMPPLDTNNAGAEATYQELIEQMKHMSAEELQDQVHRSFFFTLCSECQPKFLANPLGRPRHRKVGEN